MTKLTQTSQNWPSFLVTPKCVVHLFHQGKTRDNLNQEEELTTPGFGNDLQKKYAEFRELDLFTDLTLRIEKKSYKVNIYRIPLTASSWNIPFLHALIFTNYMCGIFCRSMNVIAGSELTAVDWDRGTALPKSPYLSSAIFRTVGTEKKMSKYSLRNTGSATVFHDCELQLYLFYCRFTKL